MSDGTRGGSTNAALDLIATEDLSAGTFSGKKAQIVKLGVGAHGAMEDVDSTHPLPVNIGVDADESGNLPVAINGSLVGGSAHIGEVAANGVVAHDAVDAANPVVVGGYASAAAPTNVSADGDAVNSWHLRNGAQATVLTAAGALVGGDATNGLDVDVTRLPALVAGSAIIGKVGIDQTTPGTTNAVSAVLTTGSAAIGKLAANDGVDVGDVTINNSTGASAVNIQDGGNSITVDGTVTATVGTVTAVTSITNVVHVDDNSGSLTVDGTVVPTGGVSAANGQVTISNSHTTIAGARTARNSLLIINRQTVAVWIGIATVTTANGVRLDPGDSITLTTTALIEGITAAAYSASGDAQVQYIETYS